MPIKLISAVFATIHSLPGEIGVVAINAINEIHTTAGIFGRDAHLIPRPITVNTTIKIIPGSAFNGDTPYPTQLPRIAMIPINANTFVFQSYFAASLRVRPILGSSHSYRRAVTGSEKRSHKYVPNMVEIKLAAAANKAISSASFGNVTASAPDAAAIILPEPTPAPIASEIGWKIPRLPKNPARIAK